MSLYGDYKAGLLDESEYTRLCRQEAREDYDFDESEDFFDDDEIDEF